LDENGLIMTRPKRLIKEQDSKPGHPSREDLAIPEGPRDGRDLSIKDVAGKPASYAFSVDFPATLTAIVRSEEAGGFSAEVPALPGCFTQGETLEELQDNLNEAAEGWLKVHHDFVLLDLLRTSFEEADEE
jgi:predicted RNase H-like HicB family nuclease